MGAAPAATGLAYAMHLLALFGASSAVFGAGFALRMLFFVLAALLLAVEASVMANLGEPAKCGNLQRRSGQRFAHGVHLITLSRKPRQKYPHRKQGKAMA